MFVRKLSGILVAGSLAFSSVAVSAAPVARASAPVAEANELSTVDYFFAALAAAIVIWAIIEHTDDDEPASP